MSVPVDKILYDKIKKRIYKEQPNHSLYRSARIVKEYKKAGGEYEYVKKSKSSRSSKNNSKNNSVNRSIKNNKSKSKSKSKKEMNIPLWFNQKWISINDYIRGNIKPCGSTDTFVLYKEYPLCRPLQIAKSLSNKELKKMINEKNKLKKKPLITQKILGTDKFNIKPTKSGISKI